MVLLPLSANNPHILVHVVDTINVLQSMTPHFMYAHLAPHVFRLMLTETQNAFIIQWDVDTYPVISIKHEKSEDIRGVLHYSIKSGKQTVPSQ